MILQLHYIGHPLSLNIAMGERPRIVKSEGNFKL